LLYAAYTDRLKWKFLAKDGFGLLINAANQYASYSALLAKLTALQVTACRLAGTQRISVSHSGRYREHSHPYGDGFGSTLRDLDKSFLSRQQRGEN